MSLIDVNICSSDISSFHKVKKTGNRIVRFVNRKCVDKIQKKGKNLKDVDMRAIWNCEEKVEVYANLTPLNLKLRFLCKKLKQKNLIVAFGFNGTGIWAQRHEDTRKVMVDSEDDIFEFLPEGMSVFELSAGPAS